MKRYVKIIVLMLSIILVCSLVVSFADVGDWNDYDYDYDYNYNDYDYDYDYDDNYYHNHNNSYYGNGNDGTIIFVLSIFFIALCMMYSLYSDHKKQLMYSNKNKSTYKNKIKNMDNVSVNNYKQHLNQIAELEKNDKSFNKEEFLQWVDSIFMELQVAWTNKDTDKIKALEDNELYATHKAQLERYIKDKKTNYIERIAIKNKKIDGYEETKKNLFIHVTLQVDMVDYIKDDSTGKIIKGRTDDKVKMEYSIIFKSDKGEIKNSNIEKQESIKCPNCGAPIDISVSARCSYCNSIINASKYNWIISSYRGRNI